jgi:hypothetical protein
MAVSPKMKGQIRQLRSDGASVASISRTVGLNYGQVYRVINAPPPKPRVSIPEERAALLGTRPDAELATSWGISEQAVSAARRRRGVQSYRRSTGWGSGGDNG